MPSKKKRAAKVDDDGEDAPNPVFTLGQRLDKTKLKRISMLYAVVGQEERQVNELLESCKLNRPEVDYMPGIHDSKGRAYGQNSIGNLPKWIMRIVSGAMYESLDICNAAASILVQLADREQAAVPVLFSRFVHGGREDMQKLLLEQVGKEDTPLNRKWAKKQFNSVINQKSVPADYAIDCPLMRDWAQACKSLGEQLKRFTAFGDVWALAQSLDDKPNKLATFISYVYQRFELQIMLEVMKYCSAQNIQVGVYKYDELLVESDMHKGGPQVLTPARLADIRAHVSRSTGLDVEFHADSCLPTIEDMKKFYGTVNLNKLSNYTDCCRELLVEHGSANKLLRYEGSVLRPHATVPGVYEPWLDFKAYTAEVLRSSVYYTDNLRSGFDTLDRYLAHVDHPFFPLMSPASMHSDWVSFRNCSFNIKTLEYRTWDDFKEKGEQPPFTDHFYDFDIDFAKLAEADNHGDEWLTPLWTDTLKLQLSPEMCYVFEVLVGRLMYPVGSIDNWQVMPFLLGDGGSGKGTVLDIIKKLKPRGKVGVLNKNMEEKFGLEGLYQKELVMCLDLPRNFAGVLDQATMQSMISGEDVAVPRKHKTAVTDLRWSPPLVMAGNIILNYNDEQGQWKRRLALFYWENIPDRVPARWRGLKGRRGGGGGAPGAHAPRTVDDKPDADFWRDIAPPALKHNQRYTESRMNFLARFLHEGSREQGVIPDKGRLTEWTNFVSVYGQYLKELEQGNTKASDDIPLAALRGNGYEVFPPLTGPGAGRGAHKKDRRAYFCVYCPHSKDGSGHQCNPAGICRDGLCWYVNCKNEAHKGAGVLKAHGIVNMRIVTRAEFDRWLIITEEAGSESEPSESLSKSLSESPSVKEWQERVLTLAAAQENTEKIRRATEKMLEANSKAERKAERRRVCQIAGIKDWKALKKKYKEAHKRKGEEQQAQGASSKRSRLSAEAVQERAEKYTSDKNEHNE